MLIYVKYHDLKNKRESIKTYRFIETLANMTNGYVAADINAVCREAALLAVQRASKNLQE